LFDTTYFEFMHTTLTPIPTTTTTTTRPVVQCGKLVGKAGTDL
jgi:hypothetical protein